MSITMTVRPVARPQTTQDQADDLVCQTACDSGICPGTGITGCVDCPAGLGPQETPQDIRCECCGRLASHIVLTPFTNIRTGETWEAWEGSCVRHLPTGETWETIKLGAVR